MIAAPAASCGAASELLLATLCEAAAVAKPLESDTNVTPPASSVAGSSTSGSSSGGESSGGDADELTKVGADERHRQRESQLTATVKTTSRLQAKADELFIATQSRAWREALLAIDEESGACSEIVLASDVAPEVFATLISRHDALPKSMRYDAHTRKVTVSDLGLARRGVPIMTFRNPRPTRGSCVHTRRKGRRGKTAREQAPPSSCGCGFKHNLGDAVPLRTEVRRVGVPERSSSAPPSRYLSAK